MKSQCRLAIIYLASMISREMCRLRKKTKSLDHIRTSVCDVRLMLFLPSPLSPILDLINQNDIKAIDFTFQICDVIMATMWSAVKGFIWDLGSGQAAHDSSMTWVADENVSENRQRHGEPDRDGVHHDGKAGVEQEKPNCTCNRTQSNDIINSMYSIP